MTPKLHKSLSLSFVLGKVILSAAWADGEIQPEEQECLKDLLFQLPDLTDEEWRSLEQSMNDPILAEERTDVLKSMRHVVQTEDDLSFVFYCLERVIYADGLVTEEERSLIEELRGILSEFGPNVYKELDAILDKSVTRREEVVNRRQKGTSDPMGFVKDRLFNEVQGYYREGRIEINLDNNSARRLCFAGALMARVVRTNEEITQQDIESVSKLLQSHWGLLRDGQDLVTKAALNLELSEMDIVRCCRQLYDLTGQNERHEFINALFKVALSDNVLRDYEVEAIMEIAANLKVDHLTFQHFMMRYAGDVMGEV